MQLIEMDIPMVLALNMMDEVRENGGTIKVNASGRSIGNTGYSDFSGKK